MKKKEATIRLRERLASGMSTDDAIAIFEREWTGREDEQPTTADKTLLPLCDPDVREEA